MIVENILLPRFLILELVLIFHFLQFKSCGGVRLNRFSLMVQLPDHQNDTKSSQVSSSKGGGVLGLKSLLLGSNIPTSGIKGLKYVLSQPLARCHVDLDEDGWSAGRHHLPLLYDSLGKDVLPDEREDSRRMISMEGGKGIELACPGSRLRGREEDRLRGVCISGDQFDVLGEKVGLSSLGCTKSPREVEKLTQLTCGAERKGIILNIGFQIGDLFHPQITVCHNSMSESTFYTNHTIFGAGLRARSKEMRRPMFREGKEFFKTVSADRAYKQKSQKTMFSRIVGDGKSAQYYSGRGGKFLARGHLAPDADFLYREWQEATYFYANAAPQWQSFNNGNWKAVEEAVRNYAKIRGVTLSIHTGTLGVLKLADDNRRYSEVWIAQETKTKKKKIPAPLYYWKIVTRQDTGNSIVFVGINNPYMQRVTRSKVFCPDISSSSGWGEVLQDRTSVLSGYTFCCSVEEFKKTVPWVPVSEHTDVLVRD